MKKITYFGAVALIFMSSFLLTCKKENDIENKEQQGQEVSFAINIANFKNGSALKSALAYSLNNAKKVSVGIKNKNNHLPPIPPFITTYELNIYQMNDKFFTETLILTPSSYKLMQFLVLDSLGNTIFAIPQAFSQEAQNVTQPLPIDFDIIKDMSIPVNVEVLSTENKTPADFGLVSFPISEVKTLDFPLAVIEKGSARLLPGVITISSGSYSYIQILDSIVSNVITVRDDSAFTTYTLKVEAQGYQPYIHVYTKDDLKSHTYFPLLIELEDKQLTGTVTDIDGNVYKTVKIGNQWWMAENLRVTHYRDGVPIPNVTDGGGRCYQNNDSAANALQYGALYNWYSVNTLKLSPEGWHVASNNDWSTLINYLGGGGVAGGKMKEMGTIHWESPNTGATNASGFTCRGGGQCLGNGEFLLFMVSSNFWSSDESGTDNAWVLEIWNNFAGIISVDYNEKNRGNSIRCVKD